MRNYTVTAIIAALGIAGAAQAQQTRVLDLSPSGLTVRGGIVLPLDDALESIGESLIGIGIEYLVPTPIIRNGGETFLSADFFAARIAGDKGSVFNFAVNQRFFTSSALSNRNYFFLGLGTAVVDVNSSNYVISLRGGVGLELSDRIIAEVSSTISDKRGGARANSLGVYVGYRF